MGEQLVKAMLFGTVEGLEPHILFLYQRLGLFHLFSASGYHMAAALLVSELVGKVFSFLKAPLKLYLQAAFTLSLMTFFGEATEWSSPMVRAYAMASLCITAEIFGIRPHKPHLFASALLVSAFFGNSGPLSFLLSGLGMAGVLLSAGKGWMAMALAPWLFTLPVVLWSFSLLNPFAVFWNLLAIFVGALVLPLSILALLAESLVDLYFLPSFLMELFHDFLVNASSLDQSFWVSREVVVLSLALAFLCQTRKRILLALFTCLLLRTFIIPTFAVLDVKQGDALFFLTKDQEKWLVDVGPRGSWASGSLEKIGVGSLDHILITHLDLDHRGGLEHILSRHKAGDLRLREEHLFDDRSEDILSWAERTDTPLRRVPQIDPSMECWLPPLQKSSNESSVICRAELLNEENLCLMGDAGFATENWLVGQNHKKMNCKYLKVGHHGSRASTSDFFLKHAGAQEALISCGKKNRYGHPHRELLDRLRESELSIRRTDLSGTLTDSVWRRFVDWESRIPALLPLPF